MYWALGTVGCGGGRGGGGVGGGGATMVHGSLESGDWTAVCHELLLREAAPLYWCSPVPPTATHIGTLLLGDNTLYNTKTYHLQLRGPPGIWLMILLCY